MTAVRREGQSRAAERECAMIVVRRAELEDLPAIVSIYNEAILTTTATFDTEPKTVAERTEWFQAHGDRHPILVAVENGEVVGWSSLTRWSDRKAYDETAETSFYVRAEARGRGIGRQLKQATIDEARRLGFTRSSRGSRREAGPACTSTNRRVSSTSARFGKSDGSSADCWTYTSCRRCCEGMRMSRAIQRSCA